MDYGQVRELNSILLDKYNKHENELTYTDYYLFQITSFVLSLFRERMLNTTRISLSQAFMIRCIIEDLAVMRLFESTEMPEFTTELLQAHQYLCEYTLYKKYSTLDGVSFDLSKMKQNYEDVKEFYKEVLNDISSKEYRDIIKSKLPFLRAKHSFYNLIDMYCPMLLDIYQILSVVLHPSELVTNYCYFRIDSLDKILNPVFMLVADEINKYYPNIVASEEHKYKNELRYCYGTKGSYSPIVIADAPQLAILKKFSEKIHNDYKLSSDTVCLPEVFFTRVVNELESILYDKTFGFSEIIKSKVKPIFELFAVFHYVIKSNNPRVLLLMERHTTFNQLKLDKEDYSKELEDTYPLYKEEFNVNITLNEFKELINYKSLPEFLGFKNINSFVYQMIDDLVENVLNQRESIKLYYDESQLLSHGNGYMLSSNFGAFIDSGGACRAIDKLLYSIIEEYNQYVQEKEPSKKLKYDIRKLFDEYGKIQTKKILNEAILFNEQKEIG